MVLDHYDHPTRRHLLQLDALLPHWTISYVAEYAGLNRLEWTSTCLAPQHGCGDTGTRKVPMEAASSEVSSRGYCCEVTDLGTMRSRG